MEQVDMGREERVNTGRADGEREIGCRCNHEAWYIGRGLWCSNSVQHFPALVQVHSETQKDPGSDCGGSLGEGG